MLVTAGHRLVLNYNLIIRGVPQLAANLGNDFQKLSHILSLWNVDNDESRHDDSAFLVYLLNYRYTEEGLELARLKRNDRRRAHLVKQACEERDFCMFLAQLEHTQEGDCDEDDDYGGHCHRWGTRGDYHEIH